MENQTNIKVIKQQWESFFIKLQEINNDLSSKIIDDYEYSYLVTDLQWRITEYHKENRLLVDKICKDARLATKQGISYPPFT